MAPRKKAQTTVPTNVYQAWQRAIQFIALNDEPRELKFDSVRGYTTVILVSEAFGIHEDDVAREVLNFRKYIIKNSGAVIERIRHDILKAESIEDIKSKHLKGCLCRICEAKRIRGRSK